jgi:hypothetical protein
MDIENTCLHVIHELLFASEQLQRVVALENFEFKFVQSSNVFFIKIKQI